MHRGDRGNGVSQRFLQPYIRRVRTCRRLRCGRGLCGRSVVQHLHLYMHDARCKRRTRTLRSRPQWRHPGDQSGIKCSMHPSGSAAHVRSRRV